VAKVEGENLDFDDLNRLGDDAAPQETAGEPSEGDLAELAADLAEGEVQPAETEKAEELPAPEVGAAEESPKGPSNLPTYLAWAGAIAAVVVLLALGWLEVLCISTALYVVSMGLVSYGIWQGRRSNSIYTVLLACALAAVLTALYCLWLEAGRYQFDVNARDARPRVGMSRTIDARWLA
jgi:hypothetical protein